MHWNIKFTSPRNAMIEEADARQCDSVRYQATVVHNGTDDDDDDDDDDDVDDMAIRNLQVPGWERVTMSHIFR